jgi:hypothetical protein
MRAFLSFLSAALMATGAWAQSPTAETDRVTNIVLTAGTTVVTAQLKDNPTSRDFLKSLPRTIAMTRYGDREYYGKVGTPLSHQGIEQQGYTDGDLVYWTPGDSFAIFFAKGATETVGNLIVLGRITSGLDAFNRLGPTLAMKIELAKENPSRF